MKNFFDKIRSPDKTIKTSKKNYKYNFNIFIRNYFRGIF